MDEREKKEMYERRREYAAAHNLRNEKIAVANGMAENAAELISQICSLRHNIHCNIDHYVLGEDGGGDCEILADTFEKLRSYDEPDRDKDEGAWQNWYNTHYERIYDEYEKNEHTN